MKKIAYFCEVMHLLLKKNAISILFSANMLKQAGRVSDHLDGLVQDCSNSSNGITAVLH